MWQPSCNNSTSISPNLIKNFNPFEILEPKKCRADVEKLIDIEDDCNSVQHADIAASFNDKTSNYDLVDLFQNIFVSPQHIIKKETTRVVEDCNNVDYKDFCDKLESGVKIDWTNSEISKKGVDLSQYDIKSKVLETPKDLDSDCDPDELIDEIMTSKNIERQILSHIPKDVQRPKTQSTNNESHHIGNEYVTKTPTATIKNDIPSVDYKTEFSGDQIKNNNLDFIVNTQIKDEKVYTRKRIVTPEIHKLNYTKGPDLYEKTIALPQIMKRIKEREKIIREENLLKARHVLEKGTANTECAPGTSKSTSELGSNDSFKAVQNIKHGSELTKVFSKYYANSKTFNSKVSPGNFEPVTLMEDCNKERLIAWKRGQVISNLVRTGKFEP